MYLFPLKKKTQYPYKTAKKHQIKKKKLLIKKINSTSITYSQQQSPKSSHKAQ